MEPLVCGQELSQLRLMDRDGHLCDERNSGAQAARTAVCSRRWIAASPTVSVSASSSTIGQPWEAAYAQAALKSDIFQSAIAIKTTPTCSGKLLVAVGRGDDAGHGDVCRCRR